MSEEMDVDLFVEDFPAEPLPRLSDEAIFAWLPPPPPPPSLPFPAVNFADLIRGRVSEQQPNDEVVILDSDNSPPPPPPPPPPPGDPSPGNPSASSSHTLHTTNALHMLQGALEHLRQAAELRSTAYEVQSRRRRTARRLRGVFQRPFSNSSRLGLLSFLRARQTRGMAAMGEGSSGVDADTLTPSEDSDEYSSDDTVLLSPEDRALGRIPSHAREEEDDEDEDDDTGSEDGPSLQPSESAPEDLRRNLVEAETEASGRLEPVAAPEGSASAPDVAGSASEGSASVRGGTAPAPEGSAPVPDSCAASCTQLPAVKAKQQTPVKSGGSTSFTEEEGDTCTICFETWTNAGDHRLSALRCGHLFGYTCIERWLKTGGAKCPQCNKKAKRSEIVVLYARTLKPLDTSEQERMKSSLELEQSMRRKAELESAQCRLQIQVLTDECGKLRQQLKELKTLMAQHGTSSSQLPSSSMAGSSLSSSQGQHKYTFEKSILINQAGNCRVMAYSEWLGCLVVSQPSSHNTLIPGCGVKKLSASNMKSSQYIPIHSKQIRGLAFNDRSDGVLLSAALDNNVKLTSLLTNTVVQTYNTGRPVWSCCWCSDDSNYVYAGLINGSVLVYDLRDTSHYLKELVPQGSRCPVVSLSYVPRAASEAFPCGGVLAGTLNGACFWEFKDSQYRPHYLPLEPAGCTDIQIEPNTRHCLVTYRPGKTFNYVRCVMMELSSNRLADSADEYSCSCCPVQTFNAGPASKLLTKNAIFQSPEKDGSILVCAGDESSNSALLWESGSGNLVQKLQADQPVVDICPMEVNQTSLLATLTEKSVKIYKWA